MACKALAARMRRAGLIGLLALGAMSTASACLLEYDWAATSLPVTVDIALTADGTLPIQEQIKSLEVTMMAGTPDEQRQQYAALFADFDQKTNQLWALASEAIRQQMDMQLRIVRNLAAAAAVSDPGAATSDSFLLILSFPGLPDLVLPLQCLSACEGASQSAWSFVQVVAEPAASYALLGLAAVLARMRRHTPRVKLLRDWRSPTQR